MIKVIAEIGLNHNASLEIAGKLIDLASIFGFDYVKFQKRDIDICVPENKRNQLKQTPWGEMTYYEYKKRMEFGIDEYLVLSKYCKEKRIKWFASVWDLHSAEFMTDFSDIVKIPSALITNLPLLLYCRENFKTVIMSTGMSTEEEIEKAVDIANPDVIMHTNSTYPTPINEMNMSYIEWLSNKYQDKEIGYSGHEFGLVQTIASIYLGVTWIERHITLDRTMWGSDQFSSVEPVGMHKLIKGIRETEASLGEYGERILYESEKKKREDLRK
jgi:N-acetylneuraminate synthase